MTHALDGRQPAKISRSKVKTILIVFFDAEGVVHKRIRASWENNQLYLLRGNFRQKKGRLLSKRDHPYLATASRYYSQPQCSARPEVPGQAQLSNVVPASLLQSWSVSEFPGMKTTLNPFIHGLLPIFKTLKRSKPLWQRLWMMSPSMSSRMRIVHVKIAGKSVWISRRKYFEEF